MLAIGLEGPLGARPLLMVKWLGAYWPSGLNEYEGACDVGGKFRSVLDSITLNMALTFLSKTNFVSVCVCV